MLSFSLSSLSSSILSAQWRYPAQLAVLALGLSGLTSQALAQELTDDIQVNGMRADDTTVLYRQSVFYILQVQLNQLKALAEAGLEAPADAQQGAMDYQQIAKQMQTTASMIDNGFGEYANGGFDIPSNATLSIWSEPQAFEDAQTALETAIQDMLAVSTVESDAADRHRAMLDVARTCKACHDDFRAN